MASIAGFRAPEPIAGFCEGHRRDVPWTRSLDRADFLDLVSTWSSVSTLPEPDRQRVLDEIASLVQTEPAAGVDTVELPEVCVALTYHVF
jgi:hypothetical protein